MNRPSLEQKRQLRVAAMTDDSALRNGDSSKQNQLRGGQRRGRREVKNASRRRMRRRPVRQPT